MHKYTMCAENCWYKDVCEDKDTNSCTNHCIRFSLMKYMIENSGLPRTLTFTTPMEAPKEDFNAYSTLANIKKNINTFVTDGRNLYIFSNNNGNGKTTWSARMLLAYFNSILDDTAYEIRGLFINTTQFLQTYKYAVNAEELNKKRQLIETVDLVVWDDLATSGLTPEEFKILYSLINSRVLDGRSNIFTGNLGEGQIDQELGSKLASRVWEISSKVEFKGQDRRKYLV